MWKLLLFHNEMSSALFLWGILAAELQIDAQQIQIQILQGGRKRFAQI